MNDKGSGWIPLDLDLPALAHGFVAFADINQDGWNDFVISGETTEKKAITWLYSGINGQKFNIDSTSLQGLSHSAGAFGDFDQDNWPDLVIAGSEDSARLCADL